MRRVTRGLVVARLSAAALPACRPLPNPPAGRDVVIWKEVGAWSGHGNLQTGRSPAIPAASACGGKRGMNAGPVRGRLKVVFRSGDSGRPIIEAVDVRGVGHDEEEVADNVRWYFLTIESANVDWIVHVDERLRGQPTR